MAESTLDLSSVTDPKALKINRAELGTPGSSAAAAATVSDDAPVVEDTGRFGTVVSPEKGGGGDEFGNFEVYAETPSGNWQAFGSWPGLSNPIEMAEVDRGAAGFGSFAETARRRSRGLSPAYVQRASWGRQSTLPRQPAFFCIHPAQR